MDYGELLYQSNAKHRLIIPYWVLMVWLLVIVFMAMTLSPSKLTGTEYLIICLFIGFFILLFYLSKASNSNISLYEFGLSKVNKKNQTIQHSYQEVVWVECFHYIYKSDKTTIHEDVLVFWFADASYINLSMKTSSEALPIIWKQLISKNPDLIHRLTCCINDPKSQELYHRLNPLIL